MFMESTGDSARLRRIAGTLAPLLDHNPRRLVQFMNLFRLRIAIASTTRLLAPVPRAGRITLEQLGKLVALGLLDSAVTQALLQRRARLSVLQKEALAANGDASGRDGVPHHVRDLLRAGLVDAEGKACDDAEAWSLEAVDASLLLQVVPVPPAPTSAPAPDGAPSGPAVAVVLK